MKQAILLEAVRLVPHHHRHRYSLGFVRDSAPVPTNETRLTPSSNRDRERVWEVRSLRNRQLQWREFLLIWLRDRNASLFQQPENRDLRTSQTLVADRAIVHGHRIVNSATLCGTLWYVPWVRYEDADEVKQVLGSLIQRHVTTHTSGHEGIPYVVDAMRECRKPDCAPMPALCRDDSLCLAWYKAFFGYGREPLNGWGSMLSPHAEQRLKQREMLTQWIKTLKQALGFVPFEEQGRLVPATYVDRNLV